jgi:hypothetical protein
MRKVYKIRVGKPEGKNPFGGSRWRSVDNNKMYLKEYGVGFGLDSS